MSEHRAMTHVMVHLYISTACQHELHAQCRKTCKFCAGACLCPCHQLEED